MKHFRHLPLPDGAWLAGLVALALGLALALWLRFSAGPAPAPTPTPVPTAVSTTPAASLLHLRDHSQAWDIRLGESASPAALAKQASFRQRFPYGMALILLDEPQAPEPLRGSYDPQPDSLRFGAVWPEPAPGQTIQPEMEAWADCQRAEAQASPQRLRCYLYVRGEPGPALNRVAAAAVGQAVSYALQGRVSSSPLWTPDDALFILSRSAAP